jgi:hypothetical protein
MVTKAFETILAANGYAAEDYDVDLLIFNEHNQVLIITDIANRRELRVPFEEDLMLWSANRIAEEVVYSIDAANARMRREP